MSAGQPNRGIGASILEAEIREQGEVLERRGATVMPRVSDAARLLWDGGTDYVVLAARGSSANAARYAQYLLGSTLRVNAALAAPSLYADVGAAPKLDRAAVLGISQSGQSPDIVSVLNAAHEQGRPTVAITNDEGSPLALAADVVIPLMAGPERSVAATKTFLATLQTCLQLVEALDPVAERRRWLGRLPSLVHGFAEGLLASRTTFEPLVEANLLTALGRGLDLSIAVESALKIRELSGTPAESFSPPDLLHGPIASLGRSSHLWVVSTAHQPDSAAIEILKRARALSVRAVVVSSDSAGWPPEDTAIEVPGSPPSWLRALLAVIPGQVAGLYIAECRGVDVDRPHGLKKVTLTR